MNTADLKNIGIFNGRQVSETVKETTVSEPVPMKGNSNWIKIQENSWPSALMLVT